RDGERPRTRADLDAPPGRWPDRPELLGREAEEALALEVLGRRVGPLAMYALGTASLNCSAGFSSARASDEPEPAGHGSHRIVHRPLRVVDNEPALRVRSFQHGVELGEEGLVDRPDRPLSV